jgi:DNA topoisomerase-1
MLQASLNISSNQLRAIALNTDKCVKAINLIHVSDAEPGILRIKKGRGFTYVYAGKTVRDPNELDRIKRIVIPPAWKKVWICKDANGHIQATGYDLRNRKQYRYHPLWNELRNQTKFSRLLLFGEKLPQLRLALEKDLNLKTLCEEKVLATVISLMERTYIRIGNTEYEKLYGSYGLTTFKDKHVKINGDSICFSFIGKKGKAHKVSLRNKRLARIVKQCREIPGKELFQYYDENGNKHPVDSGSVNRYLQRITDEDFTAKDFRTWAGTLNALHAIQHIRSNSKENERSKKSVNEILDFVSSKLGNTRTVCKKYYVHPLILDMYETRAIDDFLRDENILKVRTSGTGWEAIETILLKILRIN